MLLLFSPAVTVVTVLEVLVVGVEVPPVVLAFDANVGIVLITRGGRRGIAGL